MIARRCTYSEDIWNARECTPTIFTNSTSRLDYGLLCSTPHFLQHKSSPKVGATPQWSFIKTNSSSSEAAREIKTSTISGLSISTTISTLKFNLNKLNTPAKDQYIYIYIHILHLFNLYLFIFIHINYIIKGTYFTYI